MGLNPRGLKTIERHRPTVLPVQRQTSQHSSSTNTTCHGLPAYQQQLGGLALYQIHHHGGSVWYVGPGARLEDCDSLAQSPTRFRYMWSEMTSTQQTPDHHSYAGWKRCTSHGNDGQCLS